MNTTRHSPKREAILECLRSTICHPSAEWVYAQLKPRIPDLSLATVYRNLARFRAEGAVQVIGCVDGEDRYDGNTALHGHFICRTCGAVIDLRSMTQSRGTFTFTFVRYEDCPAAAQEKAIAAAKALAEAE